MTDRTTYVSLAGVRRRGWTDAMVRDLLGTPDVQGRDPRRWSLAPVRLYLLARVETVERTPEFAGAAECSRARSSAAGACAERRRAAVLTAIRAEPIEVPRLPGPELERRAVRPGRGEAERLLRRRLYEAIGAAYPSLARECRRRIAVEG
ncbi:hypothetical protein [Streptomyces sp. WAC08241]|uniref:hypothetical protein n=1 Tax=Streptomyces sp. WAC08241 TaxID=2487421 RepID=UPI000F781707|nr:hypothetical protein [Streptomyces sp. WAC08241]RSS32416.1 hypothetical protein EF906_33960 [Streptomyces sp. WAC08241]